MARFDYRCPLHGTREVVKSMLLGGREESCPLCASPMARVWSRETVPLVQNHSVTEGGLESFGHNERRTRIRKTDWLKEERRQRLEYGPQED